MAKAFLDTNIVVYAFTDDPRSGRARELLGQRPSISVQVLNEFANIARRKLGMSWDEVRDGLAAIRTLCPTVSSLTTETHDRAIDLAARHGFSIYDALVVAAALEGRCATLWSEDLHHGMVIDGDLTILDPFKPR